MPRRARVPVAPPPQSGPAGRHSVREAHRQGRARREIRQCAGGRESRRTATVRHPRRCGASAVRTSQYWIAAMTRREGSSEGGIENTTRGGAPRCTMKSWPDARISRHSYALDARQSPPPTLAWLRGYVAGPPDSDAKRSQSSRACRSVGTRGWNKDARSMRRSMCWTHWPGHSEWIQSNVPTYLNSRATPGDSHSSGGGRPVRAASLNFSGCWNRHRRMRSHRIGICWHGTRRSPCCSQTSELCHQRITTSCGCSSGMSVHANSMASGRPKRAAHCRSTGRRSPRSDTIPP